MNSLLSRYAECLFWMARYVERAENLARIIDVNETFSRNSRGGHDWHAILALYRDEARFPEPTANTAAIIGFYLLDDTNPSSVIASLRMARENARTLRPLISTEMWVQLNVFYNRLRGLAPEALAESNLSRLCAVIKEGCQTHTGITEGTFYRDAGAYFYQLGRCLERADQTTRLLDVKYHLLLPSPQDVGSSLDVSQWNALLRSAAGYHAFRRVHPSGISPTAVADFLLFDRDFPRSVRACVEAADERLADLCIGYTLPAGDGAARLTRLRGAIERADIASLLRQGLHEYLDEIQRALIDVTEALGADYFGHAAPPSAALAAPAAVGREPRSRRRSEMRQGAGMADPTIMRLAIHHRTVYRYARPVRFGDHRLMFRPRDSHDTWLVDARLVTTPPGRVRWQHDTFGNSIAIASFDEAAAELRFDSSVEIERHAVGDPEFVAEPYARVLRFSYQADELADLGRTIERHHADPERRIDAWAQRFLDGQAAPDTHGVLLHMTQAVKNEFAYIARDEPGVQTPVETLALGSGSCRDFALFMMEAARSLGLAARFVTGYLYDPTLDDGAPSMIGGGTTHAWLQIFIPGAGWVQYDPTNGLVGGRYLIPVGVARDPAQAAPLRGNYVGAPQDFLALEVAVEVTAAPAVSLVRQQQ